MTEPTVDWSSVEDNPDTTNGRDPGQDPFPKPKPPPALHDYPATDYGNAERLVALHGHDIRYVPGRGWHHWDQQRWQRDETGEAVRRMKDTVRSMFAAAGRMDDAKARQALAQHALRSESARAIHSALDLASTEKKIVAHTDTLDSDPWLLNVTTGTIDLRTGQQRHHDRHDLITRLAPVDYQPDAQCPAWLAFLNRILGDDHELAELLQRAVGYSLTGTTGEQVLFIAHGKGSNGKTTFLELVHDLLGSYGQTAPAELLIDRRGTIPNDVARLPGVRFTVLTEPAEGGRLNESMVKSLTGGDTVAARFMRGEWFEFKPQFTPWILTNHKPVIRGTDEGIWRRIRLVPFNVTIPPEQRDATLPNKLRAELSGILNWALAGCLAWQTHGLPTPTVVEQATAAYRAEQDVVGAFIEEACDTGAVRGRAATLYVAYSSWCTSSGERSMTKTAFGRALTERGYEQGRLPGGTRCWTGIAPKSDEDTLL